MDQTQSLKRLSELLLWVTAVVGQQCELEKRTEDEEEEDQVAVLVSMDEALPPMLPQPQPARVLRRSVPKYFSRGQSLLGCRISHFEQQVLPAEEVFPDDDHPLSVPVAWNPEKGWVHAAAMCPKGAMIQFDGLLPVGDPRLKEAPLPDDEPRAVNNHAGAHILPLKREGDEAFHWGPDGPISKTFIDAEGKSDNHIDWERIYEDLMGPNWRAEKYKKRSRNTEEEEDGGPLRERKRFKKLKSLKALRVMMSLAILEQESQ
ncbi:hypothetical protein C8J56DRAFT_211509 [Mycena floridula]|nr:hypothetical protein C8J56DRAFT_988637 [Mycena floridula]KAJ7583517.1 hypothetical protein C8J56DRAFT_211509 [Mycena floridula]